MKIRILGNSLRLRLSIPDIEELSTDGIVSEEINFGITQLKYSLRYSESEQIEASFLDNQILITIPETTGRKWVSGNQVGLSADQPLPGGDTLHLLIEKDFACLKPRPGEDENELFPNPEASND